MSGRWIMDKLETLSRKSGGSDIAFLDGELTKVKSGINSLWAMVVKTNIDKSDVKMHLQIRTHS